MLCAAYHCTATCINVDSPHAIFATAAPRTYSYATIIVDQQQPRRFEAKISPPTNYGPVNLGDSDDDKEHDFDLEFEKQRRRANAAVLALETAAKEADKEHDFDLELEKQRRRANAAVLALETAAKEADKGALADMRKGSDCKRPCENIKKKLAKVHRERCVPLPAGPPPAGASQKGRRIQGVPPPRWAQNLTQLPLFRVL